MFSCFRDECIRGLSFWRFPLTLSTNHENLCKLAGCARTIRAAAYRATFWEKQTLETQNPPRRRGRCPGKPGNFYVYGRTEIPSNQAPSQVETPFPLTRVFTPVFGSFPRRVVHNPKERP
jgi:hypothetical protein